MGSDINILSGGTERDTFVLNSDGFSLISDFETEKDSLAFSGIEKGATQKSGIERTQSLEAFESNRGGEFLG